MFKRSQERAAIRAAQRHLLTGERGWERFEATVIVARSPGDMADGEAALIAECALAKRSVEYVSSSEADGVRIYRVGRPA